MSVDPGSDDTVGWRVIERTEHHTRYEPDQEIDGIEASVTVVTPQDGTWAVDAVIQTGVRSGALITTLFPVYPPQSTAREQRDTRYDSREPAEEVAEELLSNIETVEMLEQFVTGIAVRFEEVDSRETAVIREQLQRDEH